MGAARRKLGMAAGVAAAWRRQWRKQAKIVSGGVAANGVSNRRNSVSGGK